MAGTPDIQRLIGDVVRFGTIATVDHAGARCSVRVGDLTTGSIPWIAHRAGATTLWSPPTAGEQVLLICPEGDIACGVALRGIYSDANSAPASAEHLELLRFADGSEISYDAQDHRLVAKLVGGATATIDAPGGLTITGPVRIKGDLSIDGKVGASGDVVGAGVSLTGHVHDLVRAGTDISGRPR